MKKAHGGKVLIMIMMATKLRSHYIKVGRVVHTFRFKTVPAPTQDNI